MEGTHQDRSVTAVFAAVHFLVDLACIFLLTAFLLRMVENRAVWMACVLVYNFCAFACQLPVGALGDRRGNPFSLAAAGCLAPAIILTIRSKARLRNLAEEFGAPSTSLRLDLGPTPAGIGLTLSF